MEASARRALSPPDFERMNLPREFWRAKVHGVQEGLRPTVERYLLRIREMREKGIGLLVHGGPGVGKTSIAALVVKEARSRGYTALFIGVWELRESMRSRVMFEEGTSIQDRCREVDVLVLDALSEADAKETWVNEKFLEELVNYRRSYHRVTIVTTRLSAKELKGSMAILFEATVGALVPLAVVGENLKHRRHESLVQEVFGERR
jgi:DNA replication protein DnaC